MSSLHSGPACSEPPAQAVHQAQDAAVAAAACLHHEATPDSVEGVGHDTGGSGHCLGHSPLGDDVGVLLVCEKDALGCVVQAEVGSAVHDDALRTPSSFLDDLQLEQQMARNHAEPAAAHTSC